MTLPSLVTVLLTAGANPAVPSPDPKSLAPSPADVARADDLIRRLGSDTYRDRAEATRELEKMGRLALPALARAVAETPDAEVRLRCELLLPRAAALDFDARLATFLADTDGKYEHDLPGWARFRELTGNDPHARGLFAELMRDEDNRHLLAGLAVDKGVLAQRLIDRRLDLYARAYPRNPSPGVAVQRYEPTLEDTAAILFAETVVGDTAAQVVGVRAMTPYLLLGRATVTTALERSKYGPAVKNLIVSWLDTRATPTGLTQAMTLITRLKLPENGMKYAVKLLTANGATPIQRATAATTVARIGGRDDVEHLLALFADEAPVRNLGAGREPIQVRDVALAMAAHLTGRTPQDFGLRPQLAGEAAKFYYYNYSFASAEDRKTGFARWAELEPKLQPPPPEKGDPKK